MAAGYADVVLTPGHVLVDRYRLDELLASGGMADVWSATDLVLGRSVAVKLISPVLLAQPGFAQRFRAEAQIMASLRHPGIVSVYDYGQANVPNGDAAFLVMELVDGVPLSERITAEGRLDADEAMSVVAYAAEALDAAHSAGVVHRDVKPGNLMLRSDGSVTVVDFGVATTAGAASLTGPEEVLGTALYMAPEQVSKRDRSASIDIYALGVVAYECLAGAPPFAGENALAVAMRHVHDDPKPLPADVPAAARGVVQRAMAKDPARRFPTAAALAAAARMASAAPTEIIARPAGDDGAGETSPALRPAGFAPPANEPPHRSRRRTAVMLSAAVVGVVAAMAVPAALDGGTPPADRDTSPTATQSGPAASAASGGGSGSGTAAQSGTAGRSPRPASSPTRTVSPARTTGGSVGTTPSPSRSNAGGETSTAQPQVSSTPTAAAGVDEPTP